MACKMSAFRACLVVFVCPDVGQFTIKDVPDVFSGTLVGCFCCTREGDHPSSIYRSLSVCDTGD